RHRVHLRGDRPRGDRAARESRRAGAERDPPGGGHGAGPARSGDLSPSSTLERHSKKEREPMNAPINANKALWEKGDFTRIAESMRTSGEQLVRGLGITRGLKVMDLGCGD